MPYSWDEKTAARSDGFWSVPQRFKLDEKDNTSLIVRIIAEYLSCK